MKKDLKKLEQQHDNDIGNDIDNDIQKTSVLENNVIEVELSKVNEYRPTAKQRAMLNVLLDIENVGLSNEEKCKLANVTTGGYYKMMKNEEFVQYLDKQTDQLIRDKISPVIVATFKNAILGGTSGFQDRRMLLEMANKYSPRQVIDLNAKIPRAETPEEEAEELKRLIAKHNYTENEMKSHKLK